MLLMMTGFVSNSFAKKTGRERKLQPSSSGIFKKEYIWRGFSRGFEQYGQAKCGESE